MGDWQGKDASSLRDFYELPLSARTGNIADTLDREHR
jgi:hypothetical protein